MNPTTRQPPMSYWVHPFEAIRVRDQRRTFRCAPKRANERLEWQPNPRRKKIARQCCIRHRVLSMRHDSNRNNVEKKIETEKSSMVRVQLTLWMPYSMGMFVARLITAFEEKIKINGIIWCNIRLKNKRTPCQCTYKTLPNGCRAQWYSKYQMLA